MKQRDEAQNLLCSPRCFCWKGPSQCLLPGLGLASMGLELGFFIWHKESNLFAWSFKVSLTKMRPQCYFSLNPFCFPLFFILLQGLSDCLQVLPVLADRHRWEVHLSNWLRNCFQTCDRPLALPVGEDVLGKDCRRHQSQDHQDWPYHPCEVGILQQVLDSWGIYSKALEFYNTHHEWRNFLHSSSEGWP